jgi:hypothetical protein
MEATFVSQLSASTIQISIEEWIKIELPKINKLLEIKKKTMIEIQEKLSREYPILLDNLKEVWCNDIILNHELYFSMTIVKSM